MIPPSVHSSIYSSGGDKRSPFFSTLMGDSGYFNLPPFITINSSSSAATFIFDGKNATSASWPCSISGGILYITSSGSPPNLGVHGPFTKHDDTVVTFNKGLVYQSSDTNFGNFNDDDFVIEIILKATSGTLEQPSCYVAKNSPLTRSI